MWPSRNIHVYHCSLVTHHFKLSNKNYSRVIYDVDLISSERNHLTRAVVGILIIDLSPTPLFFQSFTDIFSYVCFMQTNNVMFSLSEICKHTDFRFNFDRSPRTLAENNRRVESQAIRKVRGQKRKFVTHSDQFTASVSLSWDLTWGSAWCHPPHPCR